MEFWKIPDHHQGAGPGLFKAAGCDKKININLSKDRDAI
jgi:hypothetical protein